MFFIHLNSTHSFFHSFVDYLSILSTVIHSPDVFMCILYPYIHTSSHSFTINRAIHESVYIIHDFLYGSINSSTIHQSIYFTTYFPSIQSFTYPTCSSIPPRTPPKHSTTHPLFNRNVYPIFHLFFHISSPTSNMHRFVIPLTHSINLFISHHFYSFFTTVPPAIRQSSSPLFLPSTSHIASYLPSTHFF